MVGVELFLQTPARLKQPIGAVLGDRPTLALTVGVQRAAPLTYPRPTALRTSHELGGIELDAHRPLLVGRRVERRVAFAAQLCLGSRSAWRRPSRVRSCSGSSSPRR